MDEEQPITISEGIMKGKISEDEKRWQAEDDLRTLVSAAKIKKSPARLKAAKQMAAEKVKTLKDIEAAKKS